MESHESLTSLKLINCQYTNCVNNIPPSQELNNQGQKGSIWPAVYTTMITQQ